MLYKFKSKAAGDLIMMGPTGDQVLRIIGKEPAAKGIIEPAAMPAAIAALKAAVAAESAPPEGAGTEEDNNDKPRGVSLRQRAWPMIEMMKRAHADGKDIVWGV